MREKEFAQLYRVMLMNHLFRELMNDVDVLPFVYSIDLDEYDSDKPFSISLLDYSSSMKEYEALLMELERLIEEYGFTYPANQIFLWQIMEVIDVSNLNRGIYEFKSNV